MTGDEHKEGEAPLVSAIVLTCGDRESLFFDAIESIAEQTYDNIELVVVDDSAEGISERIDSDPPGSIVSVTRVRRGGHDTVAAARNTGLDAASGRYVAFLDDDDEWLPSKTEKQVAAIRTDDAVGVVYTGQIYVEDGRPVNRVVPTTTGDVTGEMFRGRRIGPTGTLLVDARLIEDTGERFDDRLSMWEDRDWLFSLSRHCEFDSIDEPLLKRHVDSENRLSGDFENAVDAHQVLIDKYRGIAADYGHAYEREFLRERTAKLVPKAIEQGEMKLARRYALKTIRYDPVAIKPYLYLFVTLGGRPVYESVRRLARDVRQRSVS
jgi:glycosyltransferase involved in cell wall biosynthesis